MARAGEFPLTLSLGGLEFQTTTEDAELLPPDEPAYRPFLSCRADSESPPDLVHIRLEMGPTPSFPGDEIFQSSAAWSILANGEERGVVASGAQDPFYVAQFRPGGADVLIQCSPDLVDAGPPRSVRSPLHYPLDQLLVMYLLRARGVIVHAAAMLVHGRGVLLAGVSGAGKTTFARLAESRDGWSPLSDDRGICRLRDLGPTVHGTPWPGEGNVAENGSGPLDWIFFLEKGDSNQVRRLSPGLALARLLRTASVPWYDARYVGDTLEACGRLVSEARCALLTFRPDEGAVEAVERAVSHGVP